MVFAGCLCCVLLTTAACSGTEEKGDSAAADVPPADSVTQYASNGARIFYTGVSTRGDPLTVKGPSAGPDGRPLLYCVDCHGADGQGIVVPTAEGTIRTPSIDFASLSEVSANRTLPYTESTLDITIRTGVRMDGYLLHPQMPRWNMSSRDMQDLIDHLKALSESQP